MPESPIQLSLQEAEELHTTVKRFLSLGEYLYARFHFERADVKHIENLAIKLHSQIASARTQMQNADQR